MLSVEKLRSENRWERYEFKYQKNLIPAVVMTAGILFEQRMRARTDLQN